MVKFLQKPKNCCSLQITVFPLIIGVTMAFFRMQFVKFNNRFFNLKVCWCHFEGKCNTQHFDEFFWQNREKSKYRFLTFLPVTWVKIELQKGTIHQMNGWNLYFLVDFYAIVENSTWGALGPRMLLSNSSNHPLVSIMGPGL